MEWKISADYPAYEVSEYGDVRRCAKGIRGGAVGKLMKPYIRTDGYAMYILRHENKSHHVKAHQLVCAAFVGAKPFDGAEVCHNDGSRDNDHYTNLRWDTRKSNHADKVRHGTTARGERHGAAKLTDKQAEEIKALVLSGAIQRVVADKYGIRQEHVSRIVNGKRRNH